MENPEDAKLKLEIAKIQNRIKVFSWCAGGLVFAGFMAAVWGAEFVHKTPGVLDLNGLGAFGSYLQGSVASLWSLASFLFIYVAFLAQRQQLMQQDAELEDQKKQFEVQQQSIKRQSFENTFFQLLSFQNEITEQFRDKATKPGLTGRVEAGELHGRACFSEWYQTLRSAFNIATDTQKLERADIQIAVTVYNTYYGVFNSHNLGHYFRNLYHVFKFVDESDLEKKEKRRYTSIARAQLSSVELLMLFYNCVSPYGEKFKPLVEKFGLLEQLDTQALLDPAHVTAYAPSAYE